ncbi:MAG TPA: hypothetical protein VFB20_03810 [Burkholderiales bacterium]|nr:hypothetical protein [Burkholderiales bacterium]
MIANLVNTILGILLVYGAVLEPARSAGAHWTLGACGVIIAALASWAYRIDRVKWFGVVNMAAGLGLAVLSLLHAVFKMHPLVIFWGLFWIGCIVSLLALWSLLFNRETASAPRPGG